VGFLGLFKSNFARIAENTTKYYLELRNNFGNMFADEASLLATAGLLDALNYVLAKDAKIGVPELLDMARQSVSQKKPDPTPRKRRATEKFLNKLQKQSGKATDAILGLFEELDEFDAKGQEALVSFVINLEIELFAIDNPYFSRPDIIAACYNKESTIVNAIREVMDKYKGGGHFTSTTSAFMESPEYQAFRQKLGIKDR